MPAEPQGKLAPYGRSCSRYRQLLALALLAAAAGIVCHFWLDLFDGGEAAHGVGHKRPFGTSRHPPVPVPEVRGPLPPAEFYRDRVLPMRPVVMRGAAAGTRAFRLWDDEYFLGLQLDPAASQVHIETTKKESRQQHTYDTPFQQFVRTYNSTGHYMVASLPRFLVPDFPLPWSLRCPDVASALVEAIVWFSGGGTSSVVHTDAVDNVNCLLRGNKTFVLVDPKEHGHRVPIDRTEGAYSSIDVDSVDFRRYTGMADVEFYVTNLVPGDCLFIPYKWIHQVRSYGRNIAVNLWFDKELVRGTDGCANSSDSDWPIDIGSFKGFDYRQPGEVFAQMIRERNNGRPVHFSSMLEFIVPDHAELSKRFGDRFIDELAVVFKALDSNQDSLVSLEEISDLGAERLREIDRNFLRFDRTMREMLEIIGGEKDEL